jgi:hypothetical protein
MKGSRDNAHRRFNPMHSRRYSSEVRERDDEADGPMAAHAQIPNIVKKDDTGGASWVRWLA